MAIPREFSWIWDVGDPNDDMFSRSESVGEGERRVHDAGKYAEHLAHFKQNPDWQTAVQNGWINEDGSHGANWNAKPPLAEAYGNLPNGKVWKPAEAGQQPTYVDPYWGPLVSGNRREKDWMDTWGPILSTVGLWGPAIAGGIGALGAAGGEGAAAGGAAAGSGGVPGSIYGGLGSAGGGFGTEIAGAAGAAGAESGGMSAATAAAGGGSAGGSAIGGGAGVLEDLGSGAMAGGGAPSSAQLAGGGALVQGGGTGIGSALVKQVASALGITPDKARELISGLGSTAISSLLGGGGLGGSGGSGGGSSTNQDNYWNNIHLQTPNQTNAAGDTRTWAMDPATGQWSQKDTYSAGNQALHDAQLGNATSNAKIAQSMDMSGYADPVKQFGTLGAANPFSSANYKPPTNAMGGNLLPWDYKSQLPGTGG